MKIKEIEHFDWPSKKLPRRESNLVEFWLIALFGGWILGHVIYYGLV